MEAETIFNFHHLLRKNYWIVFACICALLLMTIYNIHLSNKADALQDHVRLLEQQEKSIRELMEEDRATTEGRTLILQRQIQQLQEQRGSQVIWL